MKKDPESQSPGRVQSKSSDVESIANFKPKQGRKILSAHTFSSNASKKNTPTNQKTKPKK